MTEVESAKEREKVSMRSEQASPRHATLRHMWTLKTHLAMFIPLSISFPRFSSLQDAGPMVQMILVRRSLVGGGVLTMSRVMKPPASMGTSDVLLSMMDGLSGN